MHDNEPFRGMHKEALEYGEFLDEKIPHMLLTVEWHPPAKNASHFGRHCVAR